MRQLNWLTKKGSRMSAGVFVAALLVAGCGTSTLTGGDDSSGSVPGVDPDSKTIKIGASNAITGSVSTYYDISRGARAHIEMVNANGGIDGWKFDYKILDDAYVPTRNLQNVRTLVEEDNVFAIVVNQGTTTNTAAANYLAGTETPVVAPAQGNPLLSQYDNYFVMQPNYIGTGAVMGKFAVETLNGQRVGMLYEDDGSGQTALSGYKQAIEESGGEVEIAVPFNVDDTNFVPAVTQLKQADADVVVVFGSNSNVASTLVAANQLDYQPKWIAPFYVAGPDTIELAGSAIEGLIVDAWQPPSDAQTPEVQEYREALEKYEPKANPGALSMNGWNSAGVFLAGFQALVDSGDEITQENLINALNTLDEVKVGTLAAPISYSEEDHRIGYTAVQSTKFAQYNEAEGGFREITDEVIAFPEGLDYGD